MPVLYPPPSRPGALSILSRSCHTLPFTSRRQRRWLLALLAPALLLSLASSAQAQPKDTLTVALVSHAPTLDPHMHFERVGTLVNINMFDSLLHRNTKLEYEPSLATSWKALNDATWEFKLRKGVKFHNGDPLTAEDVKFSVEQVTEPGKEKSTLQVAQPILQEAALSFLGVGWRGGCPCSPGWRS